MSFKSKYISKLVKHSGIQCHHPKTALIWVNEQTQADARLHSRTTPLQPGLWDLLDGKFGHFSSSVHILNASWPPEWLNFLFASMSCCSIALLVYRQSLSIMIGQTDTVKYGEFSMLFSSSSWCQLAPPLFFQMQWLVEYKHVIL